MCIRDRYKANRKKAREENTQNIDWQALFDAIIRIREEISEFLPYKVLHVDRCEADDIIAILCKKCKDKKILIVSSDKDFLQLQRYENVSQWSPLKKKMLIEKDPTKQLRTLIISGDRSDGVPNILSQDDTFTGGFRQKPLSKSKLSEWINTRPEEVFSGEVYRNYKRNETLIDLNKIPESIEINIVEQYSGEHYTGREKMLNYFVKHKLKELTGYIQDF